MVRLAASGAGGAVDRALRRSGAAAVEADGGDKEDGAADDQHEHHLGAAVEFEHVERTFIPVHSIVRIDEVNKHTTPRIVSGGDGGKVMPFPVFTPAPRT